MTRGAVGTLAPIISLGGSELTDITIDALTGLRISTGLRLPARATIEFVDIGFRLSSDGTFKLGAEVKITDATGERLFTGKITGVELDVEHGAPNLTVIADDAAHAMTLGNKVRTFTNVSYSDVITKIAREHGMQIESTATPGQQEYLLQSDTDFGFVSEIADRVGYDWWVDAMGKMQFHPMAKQATSTATVSWQGTSAGLQHFSVRASALHPQKVTAGGWDAAGQQGLESISREPAGQPDAAFVTPYLKPKDLAKKSEAFTAHAMFSKAADGTALATSAAARARSGAVVATGLCIVNPKVVIGRSVTVSGVGPASGTYAVTEVEHSYDARGFRTRFTAGDRVPTGLVDTLAAAPASSFRADMLIVGVVTNIGDDKKPGFVKVKFPALGKDIESAWARVASIGAGSSRGMTFLPEINDEVIIGFEAGDVSRPVVIGAVFSGQNAARDYGAQNGKIAKRQIVSRLGHSIEFGDGDSDGDQHLLLALANNAGSVKIGKSDGLAATVPAGKPIAISAGDTKVEIDKQGNIALSGKKITLKATTDVEISAMNVKIKANMGLEGSGTSVKMAGNATAELSAGGATTLKGAVVKIN